MNYKKVSFYLITLLVVLGVIYSFSSQEKSYDPVIKEVQKESSENSNNLLKETKDALENSENLVTYTNNRLGFSMKIPKAIDVHDFYGEDIRRTPVTVFEDANRNVVYISPEIDEKNQKDNFQRLDAYPFHLFYTWKIVIENVGNEQELTEHIKKQFGPACKILSKKQTQYSGLYDVQADFDYQAFPDHVEMDERCRLNFRYAIKYSPTLNKVASWVMGQEPKFAFYDDMFLSQYSEVFDRAMFTSFQFTK